MRSDAEDEWYRPNVRCDGTGLYMHFIGRFINKYTDQCLCLRSEDNVYLNDSGSILYNCVNNLEK